MKRKDWIVIIIMCLCTDPIVIPGADEVTDALFFQKSTYESSLSAPRNT